MSQSQGNTHNLAEGGEESLRALIRAIVPEAATNSNGKYSGDVVNKLTEKLSELMGPAAMQDVNQTRNENGKLVNEEGLPIIDINEPADASQFQYTKSRPAAITVEPLIPLATLPPPAQEQLRTRRNRILDQLEEEERHAERLAEQREAEERDEISRKRREETGKEQDKIKAARELQKKMGRALIQNVGKAKEKELQEREAQRIQDEEAEKRKSPSTKKKTVAFVDMLGKAEVDGDHDAESSKSVDWGDVSPGRLRSTTRPTLLSQSLLERHPMKMSVVERIPGGQATLPKSKSPPTPRAVVDSDDESGPENVSESDTESNQDDVQEPVLDEDAVDLDYARHQREIALKYYQKRNQIGQAAGAAMVNHSHDVDEHLESTPGIVQDSTKPLISQFRANRIASAYNASTPATSEASSTSLGASVLPASSTRTIQRAIRTGKLDDDGQLVGREADSASDEEDQGIQEVLDLLRKGEVYNLGPDGNYVHTVRPNPNPRQANAIFASASSSVQTSESPGEVNKLPPPSMRTKTSKFKASRAAGRPASSSGISVQSLSTFPDALSPSVTPISHAGRSSPKMDTPAPLSSVVSERTPPITKTPSPTMSLTQPPSPFSMIVDSPSFPRSSQSDSQASSMGSSTPSLPPASSPRRPDRPPPVLASTVRESKSDRPPSSQNVGSTAVPQKEKKVSRFKAERM